MQRAVSPSPFGINYGIEYLFMAVVGGAGYVWRAAGLDRHPGAEGPVAELAAQTAGHQRQLRDDRLRRAADPDAAIRAQRPVADPGQLVGWPYRRRRLAPQPGAAGARARLAGAPASATRPGRAGSGCHPQGIRRPGGGQRHQLQGQLRRDHGPDRPERRRQEHHLQPDQRRAAGHARPGPLHGRAHRQPLGARDRCWAWAAPSSTCNCCRA